MRTWYRIYSEWDFGLEDFVFSSPEIAWTYLLDNEDFKEFLEQEDYTVEELRNQNLIGVITMHHKGE